MEYETMDVILHGRNLALELGLTLCLGSLELLL